MQDFPGNSHVSKIAGPEPEKSETTPEAEVPKQVVRGKVASRKKPLGTRVKDMFISDGGGFLEYLVEEVVVPRIKETFITALNQTLDGIGESIEYRITGKTRSHTSRPTPRSGTRINYNHMSSRSSRGRDSTGYSQTRPKIRRSNVVDDIILDSRDKCDDLLLELDDKIDVAGWCTVADLYDALPELNKRPTSVDDEWGWQDLQGARVHQIEDGQGGIEFMIAFPRPRPVNTGR